MAVPVNTTQTFAMAGIKEDASDIIHNITPDETPFISTVCAKGVAKSRTPEWFRQKGRNPNPQNKQIEGNDVDATAANQPERLRNVTQIFDQVVAVTDTGLAVDTYGRKNEMSFQTALAAKALKTDVELRSTGNYASVLGSNGTAGEMAGAEAWITSNIDRGAAGANGGYQSGTSLVTIAVDGTARAFAESQLKTVIKAAWENGGEPTVVLLSGAKKQLASAFAGIAQQTNEINGQNKVMIYGAADIYKSDFGTHKLVPTRFMGAASSRTANGNGHYPGRTVLALTPRTWKLLYLQPWRTKDLATAGHSDRKMLWCEATLACLEERANGAVADLL